MLKEKKQNSNQKLVNKKIIESKIPGINNRHLLEERNMLSDANDNYEEKEEYLYSTVIKDNDNGFKSKLKKKISNANKQIFFIY